jgi:hypothetical protein
MEALFFQGSVIRGSAINRRDPMKRLLPLLFLFATVSFSTAQNEPKKQESSPKPTASPAESSQRTAYKLDFKLFELQDGKRINERDFTMMASVSEHGTLPSSLRIGTRVPVSSAGEKPNYLDVGLSIWTGFAQQAGKLAGTIRVEVTSLVMPEQGAEQHSSGPPVLRNSSFNVDTVLVPGKPQLLSSIDDVNSKKRIQVEVVATKME